MRIKLTPKTATDAKVKAMACIYFKGFSLPRRRMSKMKKGNAKRNDDVAHFVGAERLVKEKRAQKKKSYKNELQTINM